MENTWGANKCQCRLFFNTSNAPHNVVIFGLRYMHINDTTPECSCVIANFTVPVSVSH